MLYREIVTAVDKLNAAMGLLFVSLSKSKYFIKGTLMHAISDFFIGAGAL